MTKMIDFVKHHLYKIAIAVVVAGIGVIVLIREIRHTPEETGRPGMQQESVIPVQPLPEPAQEVRSPRPVQAGERAQQATAWMEKGSAPAAPDSGQKAQRNGDRAARMAVLRQQSADLERRISGLQEEEQLRGQWKAEQMQKLDGHARRIADLGSTLQRVLKTPAQINIMASDLESQAKAIRSQAAALSRVAGSGDVEKTIRDEKRTILEQQASDLGTIALDLHRTQGDPSRVRILAIRIVNRGEQLQSAVENMRSTSSSSGSESLSLTRQLDAVKREIQNLQQE